jgi:hypothetical protein
MVRPGGIVLCLFESGPGQRFRSCSSARDAGSAKEAFIRILSRELGVPGRPRLAGGLLEAFGRPETGLSLKNA